jgi:hypothetical protein
MALRYPINYALDVTNFVEPPEKLDRPPFGPVATTNSVVMTFVLVRNMRRKLPKLIPTMRQFAPATIRAIPA